MNLNRQAIRRYEHPTVLEQMKQDFTHTKKEGVQEN